MQYLVKTKGTLDSGKSVEKTYSVMAKTEEEAKKKAIEEFVDENDNKVSDIYTSKPNEILIKVIFSLALMVIAIVLTFVSYARKWPLGIGKLVDFAVRPRKINHTFESGIAACILYTIFMVKNKGVNNLFKNVLDIITFIIVLVLFGCIFSMLDFNVKWMGFSSLGLLLASVLFSVLGIKKISGPLLIVGLLSTLLNLGRINKIMGNWAFAFAVCAYAGLLIYITTEPSIIESLPNMAEMTKAGIESIKEDAKVGMDTIEEIGEKLNGSSTVKEIKNGAVSGIKGLINKIKK